MPRETISQFPSGIGASPGHQGGNFHAAANMLNIDIDQIGRPELRDGYVNDGSTIHGNGEKIAKVYYEGGDRLYKFLDSESWAISNNGRLFIANDGNGRWIDVEDNKAYDFKNSPPEIAPIAIIDKNDWVYTINPNNLYRRTRRVSTAGDESNIVNAIAEGTIDNLVDRPSAAVVWKFIAFDYYTICYTYYNNKFAIESPPSRAKVFRIQYFWNDSDGGVRRKDKRLLNRNTITMSVQFNYKNIPAWADKIKIYVQTTPYLTTGNSLHDDVNVEANLRLSDDTVLTQEITDFGFALQEIDLRDSGDRFRSEFNIAFDINYNIFSVNDDDLNVYRTSISSLTHTPLLGNSFTGEPTLEPTLLLLYAGRIWAYDKNTKSIRFSIIDGNGSSNYDVFPYDDTSLPHSLSFEGPWQGSPIHMSVIPGDGGIYIFYRDAIRTIVGSAVVKGLYSPDVAPQTDLDASGGIEGFGTLSPNSVVSFREVTIFLGSDRSLYQLSGLSIPVDFGLNIQPYLDEITNNELEKVSAFGYNDKYHLILRSGIFVLDIKRKYWTRYNWNISNAFWATGGDTNESILYALGD